MWFGTWDGLNKYDGYVFHVYNMIAMIPAHFRKTSFMWSMRIARVVCGWVPLAVASTVM